MADAVATPPADVVPVVAAPDTGAPPAPPAADPAEITYSLTLPENAAIDAAVLERTTAIARELGLSNEHAQKTLNLVNQEAASLVDARVKAAVEALQPGGEAWAKQLADWKTETLADPSLGKTEPERTAAIQKGHALVGKYAEASPKDADTFKAFLNDSGLGNHPAANRFFAWLGKAMDEGSLHLPDAQGGALSEDAKLARMYPSMVKQT